jgi:hypothetical protein
MVQIDCPFCEAACRVDPAAFHAPSFVLRCEDCGIAVDVAPGEREQPLACAA